MSKDSSTVRERMTRYETRSVREEEQTPSVGGGGDVGQQRGRATKGGYGVRGPTPTTRNLEHRPSTVTLHRRQPVTHLHDGLTSKDDRTGVPF